MTATLRMQKPSAQNIALIAMPLFLAACTIGGDEISALLGLIGFLIYTYVNQRRSKVRSGATRESPKQPKAVSKADCPPSRPGLQYSQPNVRTTNRPALDLHQMTAVDRTPLRPLKGQMLQRPSLGSEKVVLKVSECKSVLPEASVEAWRERERREETFVAFHARQDVESDAGSEKARSDGALKRNQIVSSPLTSNGAKSFEPGSMDEAIRKMLKFLRPPHPSHRHYVKGIVANVHAEIQTVLPLAKLFAFGSSFNGFGDRDSGIDLALILDGQMAFLPSKDGKASFDEDRKPLLNGSCMDEMSVLTDIVYPALKQSGFTLVAKTEMPFVKITVTEPKDGTIVNISVNTLLPMVNTKFLRQYALIDRRVHELVLIIKRWAKARNLLNSETLSSYAWTMLVIFFLQNEKILPSLQQLAKTAGHGKSQSWLQEVPSWKQMLMRDENIDRRLLHFVDQAHCKTVWSSDASKPAENAELLWRFFEFYTKEFNWEHEVVCVRLGQRLNRQQMAAAGVSVKGALAIEDPLDTFSNLNRFGDKAKLRDEFKRAARQLRDRAPLKVFLMRPYHGA